MIECPEFLPLGSVVTIKGSTKRLMVIGRALAVENEEGEKEYYDYSLCLYPEGLIRDAVVYTNHDCVSEVLFRGFEDDENAGILEQIAEVLPKSDLTRGNPRPHEEW